MKITITEHMEVAINLKKEKKNWSRVLSANSSEDIYKKVCIKLRVINVLKTIHKKIFPIK